jgi:hypothetical protein
VILVLLCSISNEDIQFETTRTGKKRQSAQSSLPSLAHSQQAYVVERFGKFSNILEPGLNFIIPFVVTVSQSHVLSWPSW